MRKIFLYPLVEEYVFMTDNWEEEMMFMEKYAVITGASAGLGAEFAKQLLWQGYRLILVARREERMKELARQLKGGCEIIAADLTKEEECFRVWGQVQDKNITVFINNAGFGECGGFVESSLGKELDMIQLNVKAVHLFTKLALEKMKEKNRGYILNVASFAGLMPAGPYMAAYYATKAYVTSLTRAIAEELRENGSQIYIGCLCPGPVKTEFNRVANVKFATPQISAGGCVRYALRQMARRKVVIVPAFWMRGALFMGRFLPGEVYVKIAAAQQSRVVTR